jgi:hypothetical protein
MTDTPRGLRAGGRRLWEAVTGTFDLDPPEAALLEEACRTRDLLADLRREIAQNPAVIDSSQGVRVHPVMVEARQQRLVLAKLLAGLGGCPRGSSTTRTTPRERAYEALGARLAAARAAHIRRGAVGAAGSRRWRPAAADEGARGMVRGACRMGRRRWRVARRRGPARDTRGDRDARRAARRAAVKDGEA